MFEFYFGLFLLVLNYCYIICSHEFSSSNQYIALWEELISHNCSFQLIRNSSSSDHTRYQLEQNLLTNLNVKLIPTQVYNLGLNVIRYEIGHKLIQHGQLNLKLSPENPFCNYKIIFPRNSVEIKETFIDSFEKLTFGTLGEPTVIGILEEPSTLSINIEEASFIKTVYTDILIIEKRDENDHSNQTFFTCKNIYNRFCPFNSEFFNNQSFAKGSLMAMAQKPQGIWYLSLTAQVTEINSVVPSNESYDVLKSSDFIHAVKTFDLCKDELDNNDNNGWDFLYRGNVQDCRYHHIVQHILSKTLNVTMSYRNEPPAVINFVTDELGIWKEPHKPILQFATLSSSQNTGYKIPNDYLEVKLLYCTTAVSSFKPSWWYFINPYEDDTWLWIICMLMTLTSFAMIFKDFRFGFDALFLFLAQPLSTSRLRAWAACKYLSCLTITLVFLSNFYQGTITSLILAPLPEKVISSYKELFESGYKIGTAEKDDGKVRLNSIWFDHLYSNNLLKQHNVTLQDSYFQVDSSKYDQIKDLTDASSKMSQLAELKWIDEFMEPSLVHKHGVVKKMSLNSNKSSSSTVCYVMPGDPLEIYHDELTVISRRGSKYYELHFVTLLRIYGSGIMSFWYKNLDLQAHSFQNELLQYSEFYKKRHSKNEEYNNNNGRLE